jgi:hypothetical protein
MMALAVPWKFDSKNSVFILNDNCKFEVHSKNCKEKIEIP